MNLDWASTYKNQLHLSGNRFFSFQKVRAILRLLFLLYAPLTSSSLMRSVLYNIVRRSWSLNAFNINLYNYFYY